MHIHGNIYQITTSSEYPHAFLNVLDMPGYIGVWGSCYNQPTVLVQEGITFYLYQFDNEEYYKEWIIANNNKINFHITRINPIPKV